MGENTKIEWADDTLNLWLGCEKISPACANCYAEGWAKRSGLVKWGKAAERRRTSAATWNQVERFARLAEAEGRPRRVFVNSLSDFFEDNPQVADWRAGAFERFKRYPMLQFLLLTKRANNIAPSLPADWGSGYPNVWLGCTVENQEQADQRIGWLENIPARVRFLSCEPLLGPINLRLSVDFVGGSREITDRGRAIHWVIAGGESGSQARPMQIEWARSLRDQCAAANVAFFFKQFGKKAAGRILDGRTWDESPSVEARNA